MISNVRPVNNVAKSELNKKAFEAKEKCDNRKIQLEKKYKNMTAGYESILFLLAWYSIAITLFTAILSPVFFSDCISFFSIFAKTYF